MQGREMSGWRDSTAKGSSSQLRRLLLSQCRQGLQATRAQRNGMRALREAHRSFPNVGDALQAARGRAAVQTCQRRPRPALTPCPPFLRAGRGGAGCPASEWPQGPRGLIRCYREGVMTQL